MNFHFVTKECDCMKSHGRRRAGPPPPSPRLAAPQLLRLRRRRCGQDKHPSSCDEEPGSMTLSNRASPEQMRCGGSRAARVACSGCGCGRGRPQLLGARLLHEASLQGSAIELKKPRGNGVCDARHLQRMTRRIPQNPSWLSQLHQRPQPTRPTSRNGRAKKSGR